MREITALFEDLELRLIESLKRNLARHKAWENDEGFEWSAWQAEKLRHLWRFRRENAAILGEYEKKIDAETRALLKEQFAESADPEMPDRAFFGVNGKKLDALVDEMTHNEQRVERASLRYMDDIYRKTILRAATAFNAGGVTMQQATDMATKDFLERGISCIRYRNGRMVNIATYAEMALRTCNTRAMLLGEAQRREELGIDTVLVSQYGGCSETCLPWQGLVYIDDVWQDYHGESNLAIGGSYGQSRNGRSYPMLSVAVKAGLFHPNCRHHLTTWIEGVSRRPEMMDKAEVERTAKLEKKQRALERRVRKYKRLAAGTLDPEKAKEYRAKVRDAQKAVREFVGLHGDVLRRDYWRERDDSFTNSANHAIMGRGSGKPGELPPPSVPVKIGHIDYDDDTQVEAQFQEFIEKYSDSPVENTRIISENGDVYEASGGEKRMLFEGMDAILNNAKSIHNHPTGTSEYSFSSNVQEDDIPSFFSEHGAVIEAFDEKYRYRFEMPRGVTKKDWQKAYSQAEQNLLLLFHEKGFSLDTLSQEDYLDLCLHLKMEFACKQLGAQENYRRWKR